MDKLALGLSKLRSASGLTQQRLAQIAGSKVSSIKHYEAGGLPSIDALQSLLEALGADLLDLAVAMGHEGRRPETSDALLERLGPPLETDSKQPGTLDPENPIDLVVDTVIQRLAERSPQQNREGASAVGRAETTQEKLK